MPDNHRGPLNLEIQLFERIDARLDDLAEDVKDVRERVIRMEAQDVQHEIKSLKTQVKDLENWRSRITGQIALIVVPIAAAVGAIIKFLVDIALK